MLGCMHALLLAGATTQLLDVRGHNAPQCTSENGDTALQYAEAEGHTAIAALIRQHAAPPQPAAAAPAAPSDAGTMGRWPRCAAFMSAVPPRRLGRSTLAACFSSILTSSRWP